jgi:hypothetical protein
MKLLNFRASILIAVICFVLGSVLTLVLSGKCSNDETNKNVVAAKNLEKQMQDKETAYQSRISELQKKNQNLMQELSSVKVELISFKLKTKTKEATIKKLIQPKAAPGLPARDLLKKVNGSSVSIDSSLSPCDSLAYEISGYIEDNIIKDSLYETQIGIQENVIATMDAVITTKDSLYRDIKSSFTTSLMQQELLAGQNNLLQKQLKRQKRRSKLLTIGTMILSGIATNYLLNH